MHALSIVLTAFFCAAIAYIGARDAASGYRMKRGTLAAFAAAAAVGILVTVSLVRTSRAAITIPPDVAPGARSVSCARTPAEAHGIAAGALDVVVSASSAGVVKPDGAVSGNDVLTFRGWATDAAHVKTVAAVCLLVDGVVLANEAAIYGVTRPDVAAAFSHPSAAPTGFSVQVPLAGLAPGTHGFAAVAVDAQGRGEVIAPARRITIH